jgi:hypothetical protein
MTLVASFFAALLIMLARRQGRGVRAPGRGEYG